MKQFSCGCIGDQFKAPDKVYLGFDQQPGALLPCLYKPSEKVALRQVKLDANFCPQCGARMKEL